MARSAVSRRGFGGGWGMVMKQPRLRSENLITISLMGEDEQNIYHFFT